ncbi:hypothetical protein DUI87_26568 [Hirundo rustica rustica]|uniref:Uncharacterized protein n=1 Tax=Hirundo rustica rustica TaxID=333673 RepID=A0A3M0J7X2_HIRRU|nr:hypothetical protein DUI87_26568 [Hirundo rustica rustica]
MRIIRDSGRRLERTFSKSQQYRSEVLVLNVDAPRVGREEDTPRAELCGSSCGIEGENMNRWDGKSTAALAQRVRELKEVKTQRGSSTKREAAPVARSRTARYDDDDMSDPLDGTSKTYAQGKKDNQA